MSFRNRFGWSLSRESLFDSCRKRYYYHYYLSWNGWLEEAPLFNREAFRLKRLVSLPLWRGQLVHYIATKVLQSTRAKGRIPDPDRVIEYADRRFSKQYEFSAKRKYLIYPKKRKGKLNIDWLALFDHEYGVPIPPHKLEDLREEVSEALINLLESGLLRRAADSSDSSTWLIEDIDMSEFAQSFLFEGVKVFVKTDFIFRSRKGVLNIADWKTYRGRGRAGDEDRDQLEIYGFYAASEMEEPPGNIRLTEVNLLDSASEITFLYGEDMMKHSEERIRRGIEKLSSFITGGDTGRNEPLPEEDFAASPGVQCVSCNFRRICPDAEGAVRRH
jgi:hypothetical protein